MGYTHYWDFNIERGKAKELELKYQKAVIECHKIIRWFHNNVEHLGGYSAHTDVGIYGGIGLNGAGDDSCEDFCLREHLSENESDFCKTCRLPYDTVVVACLSVLKHRLGKAFYISSDGTTEEWREGVELARKITGLKIKNPIEKRRTSNE